MTICNMTIISEKIENMTICNLSNIFNVDEIWILKKEKPTGVIFVPSKNQTKAPTHVYFFFSVGFSIFVSLPSPGSFLEQPLWLNSHILNMTIWIWLLFWKNIKYDYLQYDYFFENEKIWLFVIWLFFWKNSHIWQKKYD